MIAFENKTTLLQKIREKTGYDISYVALWLWEQKGLVKINQVGTYPSGKKMNPVFDDKSVDDMVVQIKKLASDGKIRIRMIKHADT